MEKHLLLVDDEKNILMSLKRLFRREGYTIHIASSGSRAIEILNLQCIGVIISDQMMPEMTGVEFLTEAQKIQPESIRMVLSGYTEIKTILESINRGAIWRFLTKPWDDVILKENVSTAFKQFELKQENIMLANDLKKANSELNIYNKNLELIVEEKTRSLQINLRMLQVSQDILEQIPIGIIGVDSRGCIVLSNKKANKYFEKHVKIILGKQIEDLFPEELIDLINNPKITKYIAPVLEISKRALQVHILPLVPPAQSQGTILIIEASHEQGR